MSIWKPQPPSAEDARLWRAVSIAVAIPAIMVLSPLVGWFLGDWVGGFFGNRKVIALIGLLLGLIAGGMQVADLVRRITHDMK